MALTLAALLCLCRGRPRAGFAVLGLGVMAKGFPIVVAPVALAWLVARGKRRAALQGAVALLATIALVGGIALAASPGGALDAVRYHLDRPVQVESSPAYALRALDDIGLGRAESVQSFRSDGLLAAVAAFAALGKVLSPQFLIWMVPLGALALAWRMYGVSMLVAAATALTLVEFPSRYFDLVAGERFPLAVIGVRDALLLVLAGTVAARLWRIPSAGGEEHLLDRGGAPVGAGVDHDAVQPRVVV